MDLNDAVQTINDSDRQPEEKAHLRRLVRSGAILPSNFLGIPNYDEILDDFPMIAANGGNADQMVVHLLPHQLDMKISNCNISKGMRAEIFRICMNNDACYCDSANDSFKWVPSERDLFDLAVKVKTLDLLKAKKIVESTEELCALRGFKVSVEAVERCAPFVQNWVRVSDFLSSGTSPEYTPTPSVHSAKECHLTEDVQLRMIEDSTKSYVKVALIAEECHLAPRYKYKKFENDPMNRVFLTHNLHYPLDNSEIRVRDRGRSVAVPKICLSLAKDEFVGRYDNALVSREYCGRKTSMTEVFLAVLFRVDDEDYMKAVLDLLKPGSRRDGAVLVTSVLIRHEDESVEDFEDFVRENKKYSVALWKKAPAEVSMDAKDEYVLQAEDFQEIEAIDAEQLAVKRKRSE